MSQLNVDIIKHSTGTGPGIDITSAGNVAIDTNTLFVDSVNDKVGIGTVTPNAALEITGTGGIILDSLPLREKYSVRSGTVNSNDTIILTEGNIHLFTTDSTGNWSPDFTGGSVTLNSLLNVGQVVVVTIISSCGGSSGYPTSLAIDGSGVSVDWFGGSAPNARGGTSGWDQYQYTVIKHSDASYYVLATANHFE
ncbi:hypothetical protein S-MbCM25_034 [Synechococcus phage S-MbCM25]|jgi:hypothetical protein|uniref:Sericin 1-like protein n=2 Tax=Synechococcus phage ACG-2014c TaxID=1079998 RepID=V5UU72_9CAUD|nr:hypothetical protein S-MbCM25_034 [Synechococcus phage S-MbCM25]AIX22802.1 sericin 1 precursor-like protein [Synechococcus phage ACG-2014c]AIX38034.1 sericin 1 precursor-like protein [Synechococcus phage ACG-2014c]